MLALLKSWFEAESPSHDKAGVDRAGAVGAEACRRMGAVVMFHHQAA